MSIFPLRKVRKFYQVSLPARLSRKFGITEGEYVQMRETKRGILVKPVALTERLPITRLTPKEQELLLKAEAKISQIKKDLTLAKGLTKEEAEIALKVGMIDLEQAWWWLESWQKGERESEKELKAGRVKEFESAEDLIGDLRS